MSAERGPAIPGEEAGPALSAHGRLGYPLPGCVPAEPDSVSPSTRGIPDGVRSWPVAAWDAPPEVPVDWFWKQNQEPEAPSGANQDCAQSCPQGQGVRLREGAVRWRRDRSARPSPQAIAAHLFRLRPSGPGVRHPSDAAVCLRADVGDLGGSGVRHAPRGLSALRRDGRTGSVGRRQAASDACLCRVSGALGTPAQLAGSGHDLPYQLGDRVPIPGPAHIKLVVRQGLASGSRCSSRRSLVCL